MEATSWKTNLRILRYQFGTHDQAAAYTLFGLLLSGFRILTEKLSVAFYARCRLLRCNARNSGQSFGVLMSLMKLN